MFEHKSKSAKAIKLNIVNAIELKPECNYILVADSSLLKQSELKQIMTDLKRAGVRNVVSFYLSGDPDDALQVIDTRKKR